MLGHVILSEAKDLLKRTWASQDEILRFAQDDVISLPYSFGGLTGNNE